MPGGRLNIYFSFFALRPIIDNESSTRAVQEWYGGVRFCTIDTQDVFRRVDHERTVLDVVVSDQLAGGAQIG